MNKFDPITCSLLSSVPQWRAEIYTSCGSHEMTRTHVSLTLERLSEADALRASHGARDQRRIPVHIFGQPFDLIPAAAMLGYDPLSDSVRIDGVAVVGENGPFTNSHSERDDDLRELTEALAQLMGKADYTSDCCSPVAPVASAIDEYTLERARAILRKVGRR